MEQRVLGRTGLRLSIVAFGAGPVSGLMTGNDTELQFATVRRALDAGINWFDTAPGYGQGQSEANLGRILEAIKPAAEIHVATKVRLAEEDLDRIGDAVRRSVDASLGRLRRSSVTLLQLHNGITASRGEEPTSITPADVLGPSGVLVALRQLQAEGLVRFVGLTGIGQPQTLGAVIRSGAFDAIQIPYNLLNPSAGQTMPPDFAETDYGNVIADCAREAMGVLAIRVFAAGALIGRVASAHTHKTPYFPLSLYERDCQRAERLLTKLQCDVSSKELAVRFALSHSSIHAAIVGFGSPAEVDEVQHYAAFGPLDAAVLTRIARVA